MFVILRLFFSALFSLFLGYFVSRDMVVVFSLLVDLFGFLFISFHIRKYLWVILLVDLFSTLNYCISIVLDCFAFSSSACFGSTTLKTPFSTLAEMASLLMLSGKKNFSLN